MPDNVIVVGHRNPDTDAIVSAIAFADFASKALGWKTVAARIGEVNRETSMILEKAGLTAPTYIKDVYLRALHVMKREVIYVKSGSPVMKAVETLVKNNIRSAPVVDEYMKVKGLFSVESLASNLMEEFKELRLKIRKTPLENFIETAKARVLVEGGKNYLRGRVYIAALRRESIAELKDKIKGQIVVAGDREDVLSVLLESGVSSIIVTNGYTPSKKVLADARNLGVTLISSPHDTLKTVRLLEYSQPVDYYMTPPYTLEEDVLIYDVKEALQKYRSVIVVKDDGSLAGIITRSDLISQPKRKVALVDHNEFSQAPKGVEEAEIVAVVDHHRLSGDIESHKPILFLVEPIGSTSSIVWRLYRLYDLYPEKKIAEALLYAILSDTLILRSPITTDVDRRIVDEILDYLGLERRSVEKFMVKALSANLTLSADRLLRADFKVFDYKGYRFGVSQIMTPDKNIVMERLDEIKREMEKMRRTTNLQSMIVMITDYMRHESIILASGDRRLVEKSFDASLEEGWIELKGVTSRKLQVVPRLLEYLQKNY